MMDVCDQESSLNPCTQQDIVPADIPAQVSKIGLS